MKASFALFNLAGGEIILILALILILFGAKKLPEDAKGLASGMAEFDEDRAHKSVGWEPWETGIWLVLIPLLIVATIGILVVGGDLL